MLFNSSTFAAFFAVFMLLYWLTRHAVRRQTLLILCASYLFYGWWDERFLILILASTITDYAITLGITGRRLSLREGLALSAYILFASPLLLWRHWSTTGWAMWLVVAYLASAWALYPAMMRMPEQKRRKSLLVYILCVDLGVLAVFKYFNFFADSLVSSVGALGWHLDAVTLNIVLPVGISFYTFQTIGYCIDVYRGKTRPTADFVRFSAYVAFFPQLVAGPIERGGHLLPQFSVAHSPRMAGAWLFTWGLYKKIVIADNLSPFVDRIFHNPAAASGAELAAAVLAFAFQIYGDFSGYSDMARGIARMMGFDIIVNFNIPYSSKSPSEFWTRWHISLSSWLRDYLYISLGGNRGGTLLTYRNLMLTMLLGGLWHGAAWTFVLWGGFHGSILIGYRALGIDDWIAKRRSSGFQRAAEDALLIGVMFILTCVAWLLFRAPDLQTVAAFSRVFEGIDSLAPFGQIVFYVWPLVLFEVFQRWKNVFEPFAHMPVLLRANAQLFVAFSIYFLSSNSTQKFIYFNF